VTRRQQYKAAGVREFILVQGEEILNGANDNVRLTSSVIVFKLANGIAVFLTKPITSRGS